MRRAASRASSSAASRRMPPSITRARSPSLGWRDARAPARDVGDRLRRYGMLTRHRRAADQAGFLTGDEERRDCFQQPLVGRVRLEGGAELRLVEQRPKPACDAAGDVDAAEAHPPYQRLLKAIPTLLITCEEPGLIGCAAVASEHAV